jgi:hypothetical protein
MQKFFSHYAALNAFPSRWCCENNECEALDGTYKKKINKTMLTDCKIHYGYGDAFQSTALLFVICTSGFSTTKIHHERNTTSRLETAHFAMSSA